MFNKSTPKAEETARRILDSALDLFRQAGFDNATMRDVARHAGVATGAAYYYYPSKDALVQVKLDQFAPDRAILRALLRNGADPHHPLSPFSPETREIRDADIAWFRRALEGCGFRVPSDLEPSLPGVLWFFQMGVIFFWVVDNSPGQARTAQLLAVACKTVAGLVRLSAVPLMRPLRRRAVELIEIAAGA